MSTAVHVPEREVAPLLVEQELGSLDERAVDAAFERVMPALQACYRQGLSRVRYLAGDVQFFLRIGRDGSARRVHLRESSLGERETERCLVEAVAAASWPRPVGGEGEVHKRLGFDQPPGGRRAVEWPAERIYTALKVLDAPAKRCKQPGDGVYTVTAYVVTKGRHGRVLAAGIAAPSPDADERAECLLRLVDGAHLPSPGRLAAKVTFPL